MTPARFRWGIILIQLGILLILRNTGVISDNFWADLLVYAPVLLIAIGVEKIFTKSRLQFIAYLTTVGLFFGGLFIAYYGSYGGEATDFFSESTFLQESDPTVKKTSAVLNLNKTDLTIRDSGDDLVYGHFDRFTRKPRIKHSIEDDEFKIEFTSRYGDFLNGVVKIETGEPQDWYMKFADNVPLDMECYGENSDIHLNLSTTPLEKLKIDADEASIYIKLGDLVPRVYVNIGGDETDLRLRVPGNAGLKIIGDDYRSYLMRLGFRKLDNGFVNDGYDTLDKKFEIELDENLSSFSVDFF